MAAIAVSAQAQGKAALRRAADDNIIIEYLKKHNTTATRTKSGLYYTISTPGAGKNAWRGQTVTLNYTGKTLDGTVFDSNTDPGFEHMSPFVVTIGMGKVIKGWDEAVQLLNKGSKATVYIPSALAYGEKGAGDQIPPNSILVFDVELLNIEQ